MSNDNKAHLLTTSLSNALQLPLGNLWYMLAHEYMEKLFNFAQFSKIIWLYKAMFHEHSLRSYKVLQNTVKKNCSRLEKSSSHTPHWDEQDNQVRVLDKNVAPWGDFFFPSADAMIPTRKKRLGAGGGHWKSPEWLPRLLSDLHSSYRGPSVEETDTSTISSVWPKWAACGESYDGADFTIREGRQFSPSEISKSKWLLQDISRALSLTQRLNV